MFIFDYILSSSGIMKNNLLKKLSISLIGAMMFLIAPTISTIASAAENEETIIKVFHTNDTHSRMGTVSDGGNEYYPLAKFKSYIDNSEADGKLLLDAGDTFHGQAFATLSKGETVAKLLKAMGYDAMASGNHDYNYGYSRLLELEQITEVPILGINVKKGDDNLFDTDYIIKEFNGIKVGIFGLSTPETVSKTNYKNIEGLSFGDLDAIVGESQKIVNKLKKEGADVVIAITHIGIDPSSNIKSTDIANNVEGIDLIVDGHSHSEESKYDDYNSSHDTKIVSTGEYLNNFGEVTITINNEDKSKDIDIKEIKTSTVETEDEEIKNLLVDLNKDVNEIRKEVVGYTPIDLDGERQSVRYKHTNLGRVLTSAILNETGADVVMINGGSIRASIPAGEITKGQIIDVLPFGNYVVTKKVLGSDIVDMLNNLLVESAGSFTQFAGMTVTTNKYTEKQSDDYEVTRHKVVSVKINGEEIDLNKEYVVATNDYLASGGDSYEPFSKYSILNEYGALDEILINYLSVDGENKILMADNEERLVEASVEPPKSDDKDEEDSKEQNNEKQNDEKQNDEKKNNSNKNVPNTSDKSNELILAIFMLSGVTIIKLGKKKEA